MRNASLFIFDLDGTVVDTATDVRRAINIALKEVGLPPISLQQTKQAIGPGPDRFAQITLGEENMHLQKEFFDIFPAIYYNNSAVSTKPFAGIEEILQQIEQPCTIATNKMTYVSRHILDELNLSQYFKMVAGRDTVLNPKPDPEMLYYILAKFSTKPEDAIMIGDTNNDILSAKAAHIPTCAVNWGYTPIEELATLDPDHICETPEDLKQFF